MNTRRAYVDLIYNGTAATAEISGFVTDISYTDPASGEADSLDITAARPGSPVDGGVDPPSPVTPGRDQSGR